MIDISYIIVFSFEYTIGNITYSVPFLRQYIQKINTIAFNAVVIFNTRTTRAVNLTVLTFISFISSNSL